MAKITVTVRVEIVESDGHAVAYEETRPDVATGGNCGFFAQDVQIGCEHLTEKVVKAVSGRFGDLRDREDFDIQRSNYVARAFR